MALFTRAELENWLRESESSIDADVYTLCHDAAVGYLEAELNVHLTESDSAEATYTVRYDDCWIDLPVPLRAVNSVTVDGDTLTVNDDYQVVNNRLYRSVGWGGSRWWSSDRFAIPADDEYVQVVVDMDYGFTTAPQELKTWGLVLASQSFKLAPNANIQSLRIDDYSETFVTSGSLMQSTVGLPPEVLKRLRSRYGNGPKVVTSR